MYQVRFYTGEYLERQRAANRDGAAAYVEQHFNAGSPTADYSLVVVGSNASETSKAWGRDYARRCKETFGTSLGDGDGVSVGGYRGRGNANLKYTAMPAILLEPLFASNPRHAAIIRSPEGQRQLATILVESVRKFFPKGSLIAFSIGHKGKPSAPKDRGAAMHGGGTEAEFAEKVLNLAARMLSEPETAGTTCPCCGQPIKQVVA